MSLSPVLNIRTSPTFVCATCFLDDPSSHTNFQLFGCYRRNPRDRNYEGGDLGEAMFDTRHADWYCLRAYALQNLSAPTGPTAQDPGFGRRFTHSRPAVFSATDSVGVIEARKEDLKWGWVPLCGAERGRLPSADYIQNWANTLSIVHPLRITRDRDTDADVENPLQSGRNIDFLPLTTHGRRL